jgi:hypothetical protein
MCYPNKEGVPLKGTKGNSAETKSRRRTWIKPEFEFVDLCCEVTLYHHR